MSGWRTEWTCRSLYRQGMRRVLASLRGRTPAPRTIDTPHGA
nr:hypothetical protein [uncultured Fretibacterium sp.]